jgi:hypothetical protein
MPAAIGQRLGAGAAPAAALARGRAWLAGAPLAPPRPAARRRPAAAAPAVSAAQQQLELDSASAAAAAPSGEAAPAAPRFRERGAALPSLEVARRLKISAANKGRVPWNKGRPCSDAERSKISAATRAAMQRPDVVARMAEANQHRPPHREEVKQKIRSILRERARVAKEAIEVQAGRIVEMMQRSEDAEERAAGAAPERAAAAIKSMAWRLIKQDWHMAGEHWVTDRRGFRTLTMKRIRDLEALEEKARAGPGRRGRALTAGGRVRLALATHKKLGAASGKLEQVQAALEKLQAAVSLRAARRTPHAAPARAHAARLELGPRPGSLRARARLRPPALPRAPQRPSSPAAAV